MSDGIRLETLRAADLRDVLDAPRDELRQEVEQFLERIGGWENAWLAVELLEELEREELW